MTQKQSFKGKQERRTGKKEGNEGNEEGKKEGEREREKKKKRCERERRGEEKTRQPKPRHCAQNQNQKREGDKSHQRPLDSSCNVNTGFGLPRDPRLRVPALRVGAVRLAPRNVFSAQMCGQQTAAIYAKLASSTTSSEMIR